MCTCEKHTRNEIRFAPREEKMLSEKLLSKRKLSTGAPLSPMVLLNFSPAPGVLWPLECVQRSWKGVAAHMTYKTPRPDIASLAAFFKNPHWSGNTREKPPVSPQPVRDVHPPDAAKWTLFAAEVFYPPRNSHASEFPSLLSYTAQPEFSYRHGGVESVNYEILDICVPVDNLIIWQPFYSILFNSHMLPSS